MTTAEKLAARAAFSHRIARTAARICAELGTPAARATARAATAAARAATARAIAARA